MNTTPGTMTVQDESIILCRLCGYRMEGGACSECGAGPHEQLDRNILLERGRKLGRVVLLIKIALAIEIILIAITFVAPTLRAVPLSGELAANLRIGLDIALTITPGTLAAIATAKLIRGPWNLSPGTTFSVQVACLLFLLYPSCQVLGILWYLNPSVTLQGIIEWGYSLYSFAIFAATAILIRALGICSHQDPGGSERWFLRHAWIGFLILAVLYEITSLALVRIWSNMVATGMPANLDMDAVLYLNRTLAVVYMISAVIWMSSLIPWRMTISSCTRVGDHP